MVTSDRPTRDTLEALRLTLERVEQSTDPSADAEEIAELKRILLARIANLEALNALGSQSPVSATADDPPAIPVAALPPLEVVAAQEPTQKAADTTPPVIPPSELE